MTDKYDRVVAALAELIALTDTPPPLFTDAKEVLEKLHDELAAARRVAEIWRQIAITGKSVAIYRYCENGKKFAAMVERIKKAKGEK